jgi:uncharacterized RDD family membrane protein YckC
MSEELHKAGILVRTVAKILDFIIIAAAVELVPKAGYLAGLAYLLIGDSLFGGQSLGKKLVGLKVVSSDTQRACTLREAILRNSTLGAGYLFYKVIWIGWLFIVMASAFEFIILLGSKNHMRLGDEIAKTTVIEIPQAKQEA